MGVCHAIKLFEIDAKQVDLISGEDEYYIDMELNSIVDRDVAESYINNAILESGLPISFDDMAAELGLVSSYRLSDWCYSIDNIIAYKTSSGDYVCAISYSY